MLIRQATLQGIAEGTIRSLYRRWPRPRLKPGTSLRTRIGVIQVERVERSSPTQISDEAARAAGHRSRAELLAELERHGDGDLYRIDVQLAGPDPRRALRAQASLTPIELEALDRRLARLGARSAEGPWALRVLRLIAERPAVRAADLARELSLEPQPFKARVRQLKELGLTESLEVGYRLSPRGRAVLRHHGAGA
jgi:DNA-binding MarR family transcriptional regulator